MDNMPPLPSSEYGLAFYDEGGAHELPGRSYTADQMHAYARAYAEQRVRPLVEALLVSRDHVYTRVTNLREMYAGYERMYSGEQTDLALIDAAIAAEQEKQHG